MSFLIFVGILFIWCLLGILISRKNALSSTFHTYNDIAKPIFLLVVPVIIMVLNFIVLLFFARGKNEIVLYVSANLLPLASISYYLIRKQHLNKKLEKRNKEELQNRRKLEEWLLSLGDYANSINIKFYTYTIDGKLNGTIYVIYDSSETKKALIESEQMLPNTVSLKMEPNDSNILQ
ncbi:MULTISPECIES: hypothetical protein [Paenibacillus]|uniref:hypothetical protein n=1 Tax=Paenibacillus TaxID=44249 RepID=UPI0004728008|nr:MULTISPECIES: hypothetical protein [Paenibacillus]OMF39771.1 hypothetical protein BK135_25040 [Paenibacillus peoriae]